MTLPHDEMAQLFSAAPANDLPLSPNYNVCPTDDVHVVQSVGGARRLVSMRWGFVPSWYKATDGGPLLINARAETIAEKPAFRTACRERRCLIPVSGFYEWTKDEEGNRWPWYIQGDGPLALAGIWQTWEAEGNRHDTCAVVTTSANVSISAIHHRMPVIIDHLDWALWLGEEGHGAARLMQPTADDRLRFHQVDRAVNSNRASGQTLVEPVNS